MKSRGNSEVFRKIMTNLHANSKKKDQKVCIGITLNCRGERIKIVEIFNCFPMMIIPSVIMINSPCNIFYQV